MSNQEVVEDFLEADTPIPGQNFVCLSFISPEKVLKRKEPFVCKSFIKYCLKELKKDNDPEHLDPEKFTPEFIDRLNIDEMYEDFMYKNEDSLNQLFSEQNDFQTCMRGLKIRGSYDTRREAEVRAKVLQKRDKNFHVYVGQVGYWLPWDPNPDKIEYQEFANDQLNTLMKKYQENRENRDEFYHQETEERKRKAREEGKKNVEMRGTHLDNEEESKKHVEEMRKIADEKDSIYESISNANRVRNNQEASEAEPAPAEDNSSAPAQTIEIGSSDKYADPWMERKAMAGKNIDAGDGSADVTQQERDQNLDKIVKDIF